MSNAPPKPRNLWSSPGSMPAPQQTERLTAALAKLTVSPAEIAQKRKEAEERVRAFRTQVSAATLASELD